MEDLLNKLSVLSSKAEPSSRKLFSKLKKSRPDKLDSIVSDLHDEVFSDTDCLKCANCCKTTSPVFYDRDIERVSKHLRMRPSLFVEKYLRTDEDNDYVLKSSPCPFLAGDNYCLVYESRPTACREYPHTNRKRFYQILDKTILNTAICPAAYRVVEELKKAGF